MLSFKPTFSLSSLTFNKRLFSYSSFSALRVVSSVICVSEVIDTSPSSLDSVLLFKTALALNKSMGRDALLGMFLQTAEFRQMGNQLMFWLLLASPLLGVYYLSSNFLQAAGNAVHATVVSVLRQGALLIPSLYLMHRYIGLNGIAAAHTVSDLSAIVVSFALCFRQYLIFMRSMKKQ